MKHSTTKKYISILTVILLTACNISAQENTKVEEEPSIQQKVIKTEAEWKTLLTPEQYYILRESGTERAFTGKYWDNKEEGMYLCAGCQLPLFPSATKFKSGTGWPSYYLPASDTAVALYEDNSYGWNRIEVVCARCEGHLGHVFKDGPKPTGLRYCINSASLEFKKEGLSNE